VTDAPARRPSVRRVVLGGAIAVVALGFLYVLVTFVQVWWASRQDDAQPADAIVVMGAAQYDGRPSPVFESRLDHAAELYEEGIAPVVVVTGGKQEGDRVTQGVAGFEYLRTQGVPEEALRVEVDGTNTYEELSATALILSNEDLGDDIVIVSDPYHTMRLDGIAREVGLRPHVSPTGAGASFDELARETAGVAIGRVISYRRLSNLV
jgi:uncharacterized SAM-binding protein YcdF (DUF218 family)